MNKAERAAEVRRQFQFVYINVNGRRRRVKLDYSNEARIEDASGKRVRNRFGPLKASAFLWELDGKRGIYVVSDRLLNYLLAGKGRDIIRIAISGQIKTQRKAA